MGCTNCGSKVGCDHRKGAMMEQVEEAIDRLYPTKTWGEPHDETYRGLPPDELAGLADELAGVLTSATFVRPGDESEPCDFIYALCLGRTPCIVQVRDHGVAAPAEWRDVDAVQEMYLRLVISHRARLAAVQEVAIDSFRGTDGRFLVRESPRAGVYSAPLLPRMQKLVAVLPAYELLHVDFGEIAHAPLKFDAGVWRDLYAGEPSIANYFFYPQPTTMVTTTMITPVFADAGVASEHHA